MSKTQFILIAGVVGFYALLGTSLVLSAVSRLLGGLLAKEKKAVRERPLFVNRQAWTRCVFRDRGSIGLTGKISGRTVAV
jgi:hypothetical protein